MRVELNESRIVTALAKLISELKSQHSSEYSNLESLWEVFETLDSESFCKLHRNVYFADFLREIKFLNTKDGLQRYSLETEEHGEISSSLKKASEPSSTFGDSDKSNSDIETDKSLQKVEEEKVVEDFVVQCEYFHKASKIF